MFIITNYERNADGNGYRAALPPDCKHRGNFAPLSCGNVEDGFELCGVTYIKPENIVPPVEEVPRELTLLLYAGEAYPPAIAKARDAVRGYPEPLSRTAFIEQLSEHLRRHLDDQPTSAFFLARCDHSNNCYKSAGSYYWIVGWRKHGNTTVVLWVSDDCFVYDDPLSEFAVTEADMTARFGVAKPYLRRRATPISEEILK